MKIIVALCVLLGAFSSLQAQQPASAPPATTAAPAPAPAPAHITKGSRVFIEPMGGFETYLAAALLKKNVPVVVTDDKAKADFVISGVSHLERAGWAKTIFISGASSASASITIKDAHTGDLVYAYAVHKYNSVRQDTSTAEA